MAPILAFDSFGFRYEESRDGGWALKDVSLSIDPGSFVLLCGSSGSGKTTLSLACDGVVPHLMAGEVTGHAEVCGQDILTSTVSDLANHVGAVFQDPEVQLFTLTVEDEVAMSLEAQAVPRQEMRERVDWAIAKCGLEGRELSSPARLSGGQKQRVAIASVLARDPEVLVLDDPTANLDPEGARSVYQTIRDISTARARTILLIARDLSPLTDLLDRVVVLDGGRIVADDTPERIVHETKLLRRCGIKVPLVPDVAARISEISGGSWTWKGGSPATEDELIERVVARARATNAVQNGVEPVQRTARIEESPRPVVADAIPTITFDSVTFKYDTGLVALDDVNLRIMPGEMIAVCGRNGAGKTTLVHHIVGLLKPTSGNVEIDGVSTAKHTVAQLAQKVGLIFQNPNHQLFRDTVQREVAFGPSTLGWDPTRIENSVEHALDVVGLTAEVDQDPERLSMGQKQLVAIASVLALDPKILLLDEPTTGQDQNALSMVMRLIKSLNAVGVTVVMITHDMEVVLAHASRMVVLSGGRIIADGPPPSVLQREDILAAASLETPPVLRVSRPTFQPYGHK